MRLFISINFDQKTKSSMLAVQKKLKEKGRGRFTSPDNLHLTLAFLGEVDEGRLPELRQVMDSICVPEMPLIFSRIGCFRNDSELWWIGIEENEALTKLQKELIKRLCEAGFSPDRKAFRPHITLAREMRVGRLDQRELLPKPFDTKADSISLMLSHRPDGKLTYTELYRR